MSTPTSVHPAVDSHDHAHTAGEAVDHGAAEDHDHSSHTSLYWAVGAALLVGTVVTVLARHLEFNSVVLTVAVAMFIASIKAFLVAGYFMHLLSEKKMIYMVMVTTAVFFVGLVGLILWSNADLPRDSQYKTHYVP